MRKREGGMTCDMDKGTMADYHFSNFKFLKKIKKHHEMKFKIQKHYQKFRLDINIKNSKLNKEINKRLDPEANY